MSGRLMWSGSAAVVIDSCTRARNYFRKQEVYMRNYEEALKIKDALAEIGRNRAPLEAEIDRRMAAQGKLDVLASEARLLKEEGWEEKKRLCEENAAAIGRLKTEVSRTEPDIRLLEEKRERLLGEALEEIREQYRPALEKAIKQFVEKVKETNVLERQVEAIREEANGLLHKIGGTNVRFYEAFPDSGRRITMDMPGPRGPAEHSPLKLLAEDLERLGFKF